MHITLLLQFHPSIDLIYIGSHMFQGLSKVTVNILQNKGNISPSLLPNLVI
jgi:hypothetical protein